MVEAPSLAKVGSYGSGPGQDSKSAGSGGQAGGGRRLLEQTAFVSDHFGRSHHVKEMGIFIERVTDQFQKQIQAQI